MAGRRPETAWKRLYSFGSANASWADSGQKSVHNVEVTTIRRGELKDGALTRPASLCDAFDNAGRAIYAASSMKALTSGLQWD